MKMDLITKREIYLKDINYLDQMIILKNKNIIINNINDDGYFYILHKNKLNIIDRIPRIPYNSYIKNFIELSDKSIAFISAYKTISIYKKINNKYIFSKIIYSLRNKCRIFQFVNNNFIILDNYAIYNYSMKDYSLEKCLYNIYECDKLAKINNNIFALYNNNICHFIDLEIFEIINTRRMDGKILEICFLVKNKFLISVKRKLYEYVLLLCELKQSERENIFDFIYEYNIHGYYLDFHFYNIYDSEKGIIIYKENESIWNIVSINLKHKIQLIIKKLFI